jgi:hypothetical protein
VLEHVIARDEVELAFAKIDLHERRDMDFHAVGSLGIARIAYIGLDSLTLTLRRREKLASARTDVENAHAGF